MTFKGGPQRLCFWRSIFDHFFEKEKWGKWGPKWVFQLHGKGQNMDSGTDPCILGFHPALEKLEM